MAPLRKSLTLALVLAIALSAFVVIPRPVAATQNHPTWTQGDFWVYTRTQGSATSTIRMDVHEKSTLTLTSGTYSVWNVTTTTTSSSGTVVTNSWIQDSTFAIVRARYTVFGSDVLVDFEPPLVQAVFPLNVNAQWSLTTTIRVVSSGFTLPLTYTATVIAENTTTVAAGSFSVAVIQSPSTPGGSHTRDHYSEGAGNHVRRESYASNGTRTSDQQLTSYRYQSGTFVLILIGVGVLLIAAVLVGVLVTLRRRRARGRPPGMSPPPGPPPPPGT
jgi:hypothetical protein